MQELNSLTNFEAGGDTGQKGSSWAEGESFPLSTVIEISSVESGSHLWMLCECPE